MTNEMSLGNLICCVFEECCARYGDRELAAVATEVALTDLLLRQGATDAELRADVPAYLEVDTP